jgi:hypothetical protein
MDAITVLPPNSLAVVEQPFNVEVWEQEGKAIFEAGRVATRARRSAEQQLEDIHWKIGDWLLAGEKHLKDAAYEVAEKATGHAARTLMDFARVARVFPPESRRRDKLTWSHFKELATSSLTVEQRDTLLTEAQTRKLSVPKLRAAADRLKTPGGRLEPAGKKPRTVKLVYDRSFHKLICSLAASRSLYPPEKLFYRIFRDYFVANRASIEREIADFEAKVAADREMESIKRKARKLEKANEPPGARSALTRRLFAAVSQVQRELGGNTDTKVYGALFSYMATESGRGSAEEPRIDVLRAVVEGLDNAGDANAKLEFLLTVTKAQNMAERGELESILEHIEYYRVEQRKLQDKMRRDAEKAAKAEKPGLR